MPAGSRRFASRREDFTCGQCGHLVPGSGYTNHCPQCLWSRHVDVLPGDRLAACRGMMMPVGALYERGEFVVVAECVECGHTWRNRAAPGDRREALFALTGRAVKERPAGLHGQPGRQGRPRRNRGRGEAS